MVNLHSRPALKPFKSPRLIKLKTVRSLTLNRSCTCFTSSKSSLIGVSSFFFIFNSLHPIFYFCQYLLLFAMKILAIGCKVWYSYIRSRKQKRSPSDQASSERNILRRSTEMIKQATKTRKSQRELTILRRYAISKGKMAGSICNVVRSTKMVKGKQVSHDYQVWKYRVGRMSCDCPATTPYCKHIDLVEIEEMRRCDYVAPVKNRRHVQVAQ